VILAYPDNRIVFLPQTVYYQEPTALDRSMRVLGGHSDIHLFLRDHNSIGLARAQFPTSNTYLAPDMATFLYPMAASLYITVSAQPGSGTLWLLRADCERAAEEPLPGEDAMWRGDWKEMLGVRRLFMRSVQMAGWTGKRGMFSEAFAGVWYRTARYAASYCARRFQLAEHVVTSRLHGHILASLLGIPNTLLDNSYGKNSAYFKAWHGRLGVARLHGADD